MHSRLAHGEAVLLHLESGAYHELNPIGTAIWDLLDGHRSASQITDEIRAQVDDPPDDLCDVVTGFLADLRQRDLIS